MSTFEGPAKSRAQAFWGTYLFLVWHIDSLLRFRGRFPWWGGRQTPRYHGPLGCLPKRGQGGPWAPPPCIEISPGDFVYFVVGSVFGIRPRWWGVCLVFFVSGVGVLCSTLSPSRPDPCKIGHCVLFFLNGICAGRRRRFFFVRSLSPSQVLGKCKPFGGLCFP